MIMWFLIMLILLCVLVFLLSFGYVWLKFKIVIMEYVFYMFIEM